MFSKGNMAKMLKQAQDVQKKIEHVQTELDDLQIDGESGGGLVKATVNGKMELLDIALQDDILEEDKDMIEDLIISAVNNAMSKAQEESQRRMNSVTGGMLSGMKIPGM
ncbi:MAG: YbaB/EbfC family nucleoid-associated protein [Candidatus Marinimicrobia bacterium]|nr:YbaB/EbfC family nucleoid-associated protein [Candidatus Neomarinimicrobiota bacterium]MBL7011039.1 YbaB/EbfC family nucleoid-associated protein [Candidatus Neomarinimicrobiota bacterium]MBL7029957.1 YbaB/EbfC family nucleoid-associated protein [Candidatus Neomarinimicrobiota bacterium]